MNNDNNIVGFGYPGHDVVKFSRLFKEEGNQL